ncbi:hypothetical protein BDY21DRAFT_143735 [Lineolata rhizophorae]|uniref:DUF4211 domain-containing protein n=1 Tax=Lineolata rhizophorae TaxID=578093 RepID=A0A6A6NPD5_9PEZI|nr:hypothetical protein BDY21DRAFT_143735 [Lineolata rhizophorae]
MVKRKSGAPKKARQTQLTFTPVPSSSPARTDYSPVVQGRLASVGYEGPPSKRRKVRDVPPDHDGRRLGESHGPGSPGQESNGNQHSRPFTPAPSLSPKSSPLKPGLQTDSPALENPRRSSGFSSPEHSADFLPSNTPRTYPRTRSSARQQQPQLTEDEDEDEGEDDMVLRSKSGRAKTQSVFRRPSPSPAEYSDTDDAPLSQILSKQNKHRHHTVDGSAGAAGPSAENSRAGSSTRPISTPKRRHASTSSDTPTAPKGRAKSKRGRKDDNSSPHAAQHATIDALGGPDESDNEELTETILGKKPMHQARRVAADQEHLDDEDDDDEPIVVRTRTLSRPIITGSKGEEDEDDDDAEPIKQPGRRRAHLARPESHSASSHESDDLREDMEFLNSPVFESGRNRLLEAKAAKTKAMEDLKKSRLRRAAGNNTITIESEESDSDDDDGPVTVEDDYNDDEKADERFIDDEVEDVLGAPTDVQLPIEYSRWRTQPAKVLFRFVVEWMVNKRIHPGFERSDPLYQIAFQKVEHVLKGLAGSIESSAWKLNFTQSLQARPNLAYERVDWDRFCEACGRSNHPATWLMKFSGPPYDENTLEELDSESSSSGSGTADTDLDSDSDSNSDRDDSDQRRKKSKRNSGPTDTTMACPDSPLSGNVESESYYCGKTCKANAAAAHQFRHWRLHLFETVDILLQGRGELSEQKILERHDKPAKALQRDVKQIMETFTKDGHIDDLYHQIKAAISDARGEKDKFFEQREAFSRS